MTSVCSGWSGAVAKRHPRYRSRATSVPERVRHLAGHPRQAWHAPAARLHRALGGRVCRPTRRSMEETVGCPVSCCSIRANRPVPSSVTGIAVGVQAGDPRPAGATGREGLAGHRQAALVVVVGSGIVSGISDVQHRVDDHPALPLGGNRGPSRSRRRTPAAAPPIWLAAGPTPLAASIVSYMSAMRPARSAGSEPSSPTGTGWSARAGRDPHDHNWSAAMVRQA